MGYSLRKLGEIADITKLAGFEFTKYISYVDDGEIIALRALNLRNGELDLTDIKRIKRDISEQLTRSKLFVNDILLTYTGNGYGDCALITENDKYHLAPNICKISPKMDIVNPYYLYIYIRSKAFRAALTRYIGGSSQPTIPMKTLRIMDIPCFEINQQNKIVNIVKYLDEKIRVNNAINRNLEEQAQAIFKAWFINFEPFGGEMPDDWKISTLGNVSHMGAGGDKPVIVSETQTYECPYPIYSNGLSDDGLYGYTNDYKIAEESITVSARGTIGFVCLRHIPYTPIVRLVTLIPYANIMSAKFLYLWLKNIRIAGTGTTQQQLTVPSFKKEEILVPTKDVLQSFTNKVNPLFEKLWETQSENQTLSTLRDALLPRLMSGEIDVSGIDIKP